MVCPIARPMRLVKLATIATGSPGGLAGAGTRVAAPPPLRSTWLGRFEPYFSRSLVAERLTFARTACFDRHDEVASRSGITNE